MFNFNSILLCISNQNVSEKKNYQKEWFEEETTCSKSFHKHFKFMALWSVIVMNTSIKSVRTSRKIRTCWKRTRNWKIIPGADNISSYNRISGVNRRVRAVLITGAMLIIGGSVMTRPTLQSSRSAASHLASRVAAAPHALAAH